MTHEAAGKPQFLPGCWREGSVPCYEGLSIGLLERLHVMAAGFPQINGWEKEREKEGEHREAAVSLWLCLRSYMASVLSQSVFRKRSNKYSPHSRGGKLGFYCFLKLLKYSWYTTLWGFTFWRENLWIYLNTTTRRLQLWWGDWLSPHRRTVWGSPEL